MKSTQEAPWKYTLFQIEKVKHSVEHDFLWIGLQNYTTWSKWNLSFLLSCSLLVYLWDCIRAALPNFLLNLDRTEKVLALSCLQAFSLLWGNDYLKCSFRHWISASSKLGHHDVLILGSHNQYLAVLKSLECFDRFRVWLSFNKSLPIIVSPQQNTKTSIVRLAPC